MLDIPSFLANLTHYPGVYQMLDAKGKIIYVGKARNLKKRLASYFSATQKDIKTSALLKHVVDITITVTEDENAALLLECNLIKQHRPHYNVLFRDDKTYPYILLTAAEFPRITFYRGNKKPQLGQFFGPYADRGIVRETIILIEKLFKLRNCTNSFFSARTRPCIQYEIKRCAAPCTQYISAADYQKNVAHAVLFLQGKDQEVINELTKQMEQAAAERQFEQAAELRDKVARLREMQAGQSINHAAGDIDVIGFVLSENIACIHLLVIRNGRMLGSRAFFPTLPQSATREEILTSFIEQYYLDEQQLAQDIPREIILTENLFEQAWLTEVLAKKAKRKIIFTKSVRGERQKWLSMAQTNAQQAIGLRLLERGNAHARFAAFKQLVTPNSACFRVECVDISHTMGEATVGSCVVFDENGARKSDYRRFNIANITPGDDTAAIKQLLERRYSKLQIKNDLPSILLIDGGKPQLNAAAKILADLNIQTVLLIGIAKGQTRKPGFETLFFLDQPALHLPPDSIALHFIQQIRDEAHRFAITAHRAQRAKKRVTSTLEFIPGIGVKKRRELLRHFGGIQAVSRASLDQIAKVPGISLALAKKIFDLLHKASP